MATLKQHICTYEALTGGKHLHFRREYNDLSLRVADLGPSHLHGGGLKSWMKGLFRRTSPTNPLPNRPSSTSTLPTSSSSSHPLSTSSPSSHPSFSQSSSSTGSLPSNPLSSQHTSSSHPSSSHTSSLPIDYGRMNPHVRSIRDAFKQRIAAKGVDPDGFEFHSIQKYRTQGPANETFFSTITKENLLNIHTRVNFENNMYQMTPEEIKIHNPVPLTNIDPSYQYGQFVVQPNKSVNLQFFYLHDEDGQRAIRSFEVVDITPQQAIWRHGQYAQPIPYINVLEILLQRKTFSKHFKRYKTSGDNNFCGWYTILQMLTISHYTDPINSIHNEELRALFNEMPPTVFRDARRNITENNIRFDNNTINAFVTHLLKLKTTFVMNKGQPGQIIFDGDLLYDRLPNGWSRTDQKDNPENLHVDKAGYRSPRDRHERGDFLRSAVQDIQRMTSDTPTQQMYNVDGLDPHLFMERTWILLTSYFQLPVYLFSSSGMVLKFPSSESDPILSMTEDRVEDVFATISPSYSYLDVGTVGHYEYVAPIHPGRPGYVDLTNDHTALRPTVVHPPKRPRREEEDGGGGGSKDDPIEMRTGDGGGGGSKADPIEMSSSSSTLTPGEKYCKYLLAELDKLQARLTTTSSPAEKQEYEKQIKEYMDAIRKNCVS